MSHYRDINLKERGIERRRARRPCLNQDSQLNRDLPGARYNPRAAKAADCEISKSFLRARTSLL